MSGIAKPCFFFSTSTGNGPNVVLNGESIAFMDKQDVPSFGIGYPAKYRILVKQFGQTNVRYFDFASSAARDTAFTAAKTLVAASV